ncbi:hypothetical protein ERJ75_000942000 [Trypanosoma vivax]|uniref:Uncharacterized protein n=1 Tax=Trypanosoma vivax (strain Y486) TaxID=1055687 RepID=G0U4C6_TRYVY|nr:hypothetical protein TRVL_05942 [Trypanosoma vivax]KAH8611940.1 hypothetical protein ERJ75_000942000 [Trypanosoma vivax]CCC52290.1 conserved hypothetical protein [Trypanosoma vivax Y486]
MRARRLVALWTPSACRHVELQSSDHNPDALNGRKEDHTEASTTANAIEIDSAEEWMRKHINTAVQEGRETLEAAAYFESIMNDKPEFRLCIQEARRLLGAQDPRHLTRYQQTHYSERLSRFMTNVAAERMLRAHAEEQRTQRHTQDGTPTGENYWFEAGQTLASPSVPGFVKDKVFQQMREERGENSPAFEDPKEMSELASKDRAFAEHMRNQRRRLLSTDDYLA